MQQPQTNVGIVPVKRVELKQFGSDNLKRFNFPERDPMVRQPIAIVPPLCKVKFQDTPEPSNVQSTPTSQSVSFPAPPSTVSLEDYSEPIRTLWSQQNTREPTRLNESSRNPLVTRSELWHTRRQSRFTPLI